MAAKGTESATSAETTPKPKATSSDTKGVALVSPDGVEYLAHPSEVGELVGTAGYARKN